MAKFFVGQMVRYVRYRETEFANDSGIKLGTEGRVTSIGPFAPGDISWDGFTFRNPTDLTVNLGGVDAGGLEYQFEPILDRHEPCESEFKESLDKLLSEVTCGEV